MQKADKDDPRKTSSARTFFKRWGDGVSLCIKFCLTASPCGAMQHYKAHRSTSAEQSDLFADEVIEKLKERFQAWTDNELAEKLNIGRSTITSWRRRGSVPGRFTKMLEVGGPLALSNGMPYEHWSDLDKAAMQLSLVRLIHETAPKLNSLDETLTIGRGLPEALESHFSAARSDIERGLAAGVRHPDFALYTLLGFELFDYK